MIQYIGGFYEHTLLIVGLFGMLSKSQAIEIYRMKISYLNHLVAANLQSIRNLNVRYLKLGCSKLVPELAEKYAVNPRTIRDIWNRKTWAFATNSIWLEEQHLRLEGGKKQVAKALHPFSY